MTLFEKKGDIINNQLAFVGNSVTMRSYKDAAEFVGCYPFAPYQFALLQKVFESIRKVGATGKHLSKGERSLLDAFQSAAKHNADRGVDALIPLYDFYPSIESFIDTTAKRSIDEAPNNPPSSRKTSACSRACSSYATSPTSSVPTSTTWQRYALTRSMPTSWSSSAAFRKA